MCSMRILGLGVGLHTCDTLVSNDLEAVQDGGLSHVLLKCSMFMRDH